MRFQYTVALLLCVTVLTLAEESNSPSKTPDGKNMDTTTMKATSEEQSKTSTAPPTKPTLPPTSTPPPTTPTSPPSSPTPPPSSPTPPPTKPTPPPTTPTPPPTTPTPPPTTPTPPPTTPTPPPTKPTPPPTKPTPPPTKPTPPPTTPTPPPITTPAPAPKPATDWIVKYGNGSVCIIASMDIKITVPYKSTNDNKTVNAEFSLDNVGNATATGNCGESEQTLTLTWQNITSTFKFQHIKQNATYHLGSIEVDIIVNNNTFPNNTMVNASKITLKYDAQVFSVPVDHSYRCSSLNPLNLNGTSFNGTTPLNGTFPGTLAVSDLHVEAFGIGTDDKYSASKDCASVETPDIVPIVVGLVLAGLVVVVLIAYLVGRRRAQARGYLSM